MRGPQRGRPSLAQVVEIGSPASIRRLSSGSAASRLITSRSIGRPTPRLDRIVESIEISPILRAS